MIGRVNTCIERMHAIFTLILCTDPAFFPKGGGRGGVGWWWWRGGVGDNFEFCFLMGIGGGSGDV